MASNALKRGDTWIKSIQVLAFPKLHCIESEFAGEAKVESPRPMLNKMSAIDMTIRVRETGGEWCRRNQDGDCSIPGAATLCDDRGSLPIE